ncbi:MAG: hypothetical protein HYV06_01295 [Deltaproteobacteria bacterium]|nr:hypothetical protein [Deltaproteobacteria bacterium]
MEIGRALIKELGLEPGDDTLCHWMAHYIAELIEGAETATEADRQEKLAKCSEIILALWQHRYELPNGKRPFEEFEPIIRAIESLDPDDDTPRYFRSVKNASDKADVTTESKKWLELAEGLDYSAKMLIRYCLEQASHDALDKSQEWVKLAELAGLEVGIEFPVIRFITAENELANESQTDERERKLLEDRINRLNVFKNMADALASDLHRKLEGR